MTIDSTDTSEVVTLTVDSPDEVPTLAGKTFVTPWFTMDEDRHKAFEHGTYLDSYPHGYGGESGGTATISSRASICWGCSTTCATTLCGPRDRGSPGTTGWTTCGSSVSCGVPTRCGFAERYVRSSTAEIRVTSSWSMPSAR